MALTLLQEWGVTQCSDVGDMVFELIEEGMFGRQDSDTREDFANHYDFSEAFLSPYLPKDTATGERDSAESDGDRSSSLSPSPRDAP